MENANIDVKKNIEKINDNFSKNNKNMASKIDLINAKSKNSKLENNDLNKYKVKKTYDSQTTIKKQYLLKK